MKVIMRFTGALITKVFLFQTGISEAGKKSAVFLLYDGYSQNRIIN
jgi:hypothetical protein